MSNPLQGKAYALLLGTAVTNISLKLAQLPQQQQYFITKAYGWIYTYTQIIFVTQQSLFNHSIVWQEFGKYFKNIQ